MSLFDEILTLGTWSSPAWWWPLALLGTLAALMGVAGWRRRRKLLHAHRRLHPPVSDAVFLSDAQVPAEQSEIALTVRRKVAEAMGVPPETVYPLNRLDYIMQFGFDGMSITEIVLPIERALRIHLADHFFGQNNDATVADLIQFVISVCHSEGDGTS